MGFVYKGCLIVARNVVNKTLQFAAFHGIKPILQTFPLNIDSIGEAMEKLEKGEIRYRAVLIVQD